MNVPLREQMVSLPAAVLGQVDEICDRYEAAWHADASPRIDEALAAAPPELHERLFRELLWLDRGLREAADLTADRDFYLAAYPARAVTIREIFRDAGGRPQYSTPSAFDTQTGPAAGRPLATELPQTIGKYRVVSWLGSGGQGDVLRAIHPTLNRDVVIKIGRRRIADHQAEAAALVREGRALAELNHPNLVRVFDLDFHEGRPYLVLDLIDGESLRQKAGEAPLPPGEAARIVAQVARAIAAVHGRGLVHLDIKPDNVVVDATGAAHLVDFGLAILPDVWSDSRPGEGQFRGTPAFAAPEQAAGNAHAIGPRTDVFGLGALLYTLLTGEPPYCGTGLSDVLRRARSGQIDQKKLLARVPRELAAVCLRALSASPAARYAAASELADALDRASRRQPRWRAAVLLGAIVLAVSAVVVWQVASNWQTTTAATPESGTDASEAEVPPAPRTEFPAPRPTDGAPRPQWNQQTGELRFEGEVVRRVQRTGVNIIEVLNEFERQGWPERIESPFANDPSNKKLQGTCNSLKDGLERLRFSTSGRYIYWTIDSK